MIDIGQHKSNIKVTNDSLSIIEYMKMFANRITEIMRVADLHSRHTSIKLNNKLACNDTVHVQDFYIGVITSDTQ